MSTSLFFLPLLFFSNLLSTTTTTTSPLIPDHCNEQCGNLLLPYPFHLNTSCVPPIPIPSSFHLSCNVSSSTLLLPLADTFLVQVLSFLPSGSLLLDYAANYTSFTTSSLLPNLTNSSSFAIAADNNILRLYDCEDSSVCRADCGHNGCCYPLSDGSVWKAGEGLGVFASFGCRGFSSWVKNFNMSGEIVRGSEVEWALERGSEAAACVDGAVVVNSTVVSGGVRCACGAGYVGDGFAFGAGCTKLSMYCSASGWIQFV